MMHVLPCNDVNSFASIPTAIKIAVIKYEIHKRIFLLEMLITSYNIQRIE